jgi:MFS family permease
MIALYILVAFFFWMSLYLYVPTLPTYAQTKTDSLTFVGVILAQQGLWQALVRLPLGIAADSLGRRKPFIITGIVLAGVGATVMAVSDSALGLLVGRAITGMAAGTWVPQVAAFSSLYPAQEAIQASAILTVSGSVGRGLSSSVTGSLNELGGYSLAFYGAIGIAGVALLFALPTRERVHPARRPSVGGIRRLITRRDVLLPSLLAAVSQYANWAATFGFLPILAKQMGGTDVTQSLLVTLHIGVIVLGNMVTAAISSRIRARYLVYFSFVLLSAGVAGAALAPTLPVLFLAQLGLGLAQGVGHPVLMGLSIRNVDDAERTTAMGLHQAVYGLGMFCGPWISGILADVLGIRPMFGLTAFVCLAVGLFLTRMLYED